MKDTKMTFQRSPLIVAFVGSSTGLLFVVVGDPKIPKRIPSLGLDTGMPTQDRLHFWIRNDPSASLLMYVVLGFKGSSPLWAEHM